MTDDNPYAWRNATVLCADLAIDHRAAEALLPPGLDPVPEARATVFVAHYPFTTFGTVYSEAAVLIYGTDDLGTYLHCPWMVVDDDSALVLGRELLGFPKLLADITLDADGTTLAAHVNRKGHDHVRLEGTAPLEEPDPPRVFDYRWRNVIGSTLVGMNLAEYGPGGEHIHSCRTGIGTLTLGEDLRVALGLAEPSVEVGLRLVNLDCSDERVTAGTIVGDRIEDDAWVTTRYLSSTF
jgi:acetoacetate decarboxylase